MIKLARSFPTNEDAHRKQSNELFPLLSYLFSFTLPIDFTNIYSIIFPDEKERVVFDRSFFLGVLLFFIGSARTRQGAFWAWFGWF